jgi:ferrous iron transport protein B
MKFQKVALVGNPNTGKSSVFNKLTGMNQHVGNFPGVTVDKKTGKLRLGEETVELLDLPGTYSIYPRSLDEKVVYDVLSNPAHPDHPDLVIVVVDASNLERNLLLFTQVYDLGLPLVLMVNMSDVASRAGQHFQPEYFQQHFPSVPVVETNARLGTGLDRLREVLSQGIPQGERQPILPDFELHATEDQEAQSRDTAARYKYIQTLLPGLSLHIPKATPIRRNRTLDKILTHPIAGYGIFLLVLLFMFQLIFSLATYPMDWIDGIFTQFSETLQQALPAGVFTDLLAQGIVPGLGGVVIFIPQIALLFLCLGILEETGYMARVVFIMDRLMRPFGLNGKSVVPLMSSAACAIPGIMATRTISSWKERLTTIMVAPLMSCSARIPVYTLLISLVIPQKTVFGFLSLQGLTLFALYALGLFSALFVALVMKWLIRSKEASVLLLELPEYRTPRWGNVFLTLFEKIKIFVFDAGKVILAVSIILWALASYGPGDRMERAVQQLEQPKSQTESAIQAYEQEVAAAKLANSYMGILGHAIEPVIRPLGYDWKIGISLLSSFAAREVFVGAMATIYSVHDDGEANRGLQARMRAEKLPDGTPVYTLASGVSLMVFYVYAMQCMATLAIVKRETKSWKWPVLQIIYMGILAYAAAFLAFQIFS